MAEFVPGVKARYKSIVFVLHFWIAPTAYTHIAPTLMLAYGFRAIRDGHPLAFKWGDLIKKHHVPLVGASQVLKRPHDSRSFRRVPIYGHLEHYIRITPGNLKVVGQYVPHLVLRVPHEILKIGVHHLAPSRIVSVHLNPYLLLGLAL